MPTWQTQLFIFKWSTQACLDSPGVTVGTAVGELGSYGIRVVAVDGWQFRVSSVGSLRPAKHQVERTDRLPY